MITEGMAMVEPTWEKIDLPVLRAAVQYIEEHDYGSLPQAYDLAPIVGLDADEVGKALLRLDGAYIRSSGTMGGLADQGVDKLYPEARRAVGQWPTPEELADRLIQALSQAAEKEPDEERRGWLKRTAAYLGTAGRDIAVEVAGTAIARGAGMG
ncbi:MAG TPA: hypothetical protein VFZ32_01445 [Micromonosporaceae bacterium]